MPKTTAQMFDILWRALAVHGLVDEFESVEYSRVRSEWLACGEPAWSMSIIIQRANTEPMTLPSSVL